MNIQDLIASITIPMKFHLRNKQHPSYGILGGDMGIVYYMYQISGNSKYQIDPEEYLDKILKSLHFHPLVHSYCNGLAGLGYTLHTLQKEGFITNVDNNLRSFDDELSKWFYKSLKQDNIDPLHGALGALYYFTIRFDHNPKLCRDVLDCWGKYLINHIEKVDKGHTIGFRTFSKTPPYNLSLSHGLSGLLLITIEALRNIHLFNKDIVFKRTLESFGYYLINNISTKNDTISCTPNCDTSERHTYPSRLGWCYGDLGVALALFKLGSYLENPKFTDASDYIIKHASKRISLQETFIRDRCLCHGSCGVYLIFKYLNTKLYKGGLDSITRYWFDFTYHEAINNTKACASRFSFYNNEEHKYELRYNILDGMSGLGLGLMSDNTSINKLIFLT